MSALPDPSYHYGSVGIYAAPGSPLSNFLNAVATDFGVPAAQSAFADLHYGNASVYVVLDDISLVPALKAQMVIDGAGMPPLAPPVPEPETYAMFLAGLGFLGYTARRRRQAFGRPSFGQLRAA